MYLDANFAGLIYRLKCVLAGIIGHRSHFGGLFCRLALFFRFCSNCYDLGVMFYNR